jgi:hypothetical protein
LTVPLQFGVGCHYSFGVLNIEKEEIKYRSEPEVLSLVSECGVTGVSSVEVAVFTRFKKRG